MSILWWLYQGYQLWLISPSLICFKYFYSLARSRYLSFFPFSFSFNMYSTGTAKFTIRQVCFFLLIINWSGRLAKIRWSIFISKSQRSSCVSFTRTDYGLYIYHLFVLSNFNFLHNSQCISFPTQSFLVLYFRCICCFIRSMVSSLSAHSASSAILWRLSYSFFDIVGSYGVD